VTTIINEFMNDAGCDPEYKRELFELAYLSSASAINFKNQLRFYPGVHVIRLITHKLGQ
jgi:hypothetical protein